MQEANVAQPPGTRHKKFVDGLRAIFTTSKQESDRQLAEESEQRKKRREKKTK